MNYQEEILARVSMEPMSGCWLWTGYIAKQGYGRMSIKEMEPRARWAHRVSYESFKGAIPEGLQLDHLCRNKTCVNPDHLEAVTPRINCLRGNSKSAQHARSYTCIRGHLLEGDNLYNTTRKHRRCKQCHWIRVSIRRSKGERP